MSGYHPGVTRRARHVAVTLLVLALPLAAQGSLPQTTTVGAGCGAAPAALTLSPPLLGGTATLRLTGGSAGPWGHHVFVSFPPAAPLPLPGGCLGHLDPASLSVLAVLPPGVGSAPLSMPSHPSWLGAQLAVQAVSWLTAAPAGYDVTNGVQLTIGTRQGVMAGLPSAPGAHLQAVAALPAGGWLDLGVPAPDPRFGLATGREYTPRMAWSAALDGAFLTGESGHGYVNPNTGRYIDDVWFYDFAAHAWRCIKPGSEVATLQLQLNADQFEVDAAGELVPTAQLGHGYEFVTFDEASQRFLMQPMPNTYWVTSMPQRLGWLPGATFPESQYRSPWLLDAITGRWVRRPPGSPAPDFNTSARAVAVHSIPATGRIWVFDTSAANRNRIWWFDPVDCRWSAEATANAAPRISGHGISCCDPVGGRVWYYGVDADLQQARLWRYDVAARTWTDTGAPGTPPHGPIYVTSGRSLLYDPLAEAVLMTIQGGSAPPTVHVYDVRSNAWQAPFGPPAGMAALFAWRHLNACYAPAHNVHLLHVAGGNSGTGRIVVYRHAR